MSRRVLFIHKDFFSGFFLFVLFCFYNMFSHIAHPSQLSCLSPYGVRASLFFSPQAEHHSSASHMAKPGLCPCSALQECAVLTFPHSRERDLPFLTPGPFFLCRWSYGHRAWQGSPAPSGIYRLIMPSRGHSFFPSHWNTWDPCWPSITCGDRALHLCDSWVFLFLFWVFVLRQGQYLEIIQEKCSVGDYSFPLISLQISFLSSVKWSVPPEKTF